MLNQVLWLPLHIAKIGTFTLQEIVERTVKLKPDVVRNNELPILIEISCYSQLSSIVGDVVLIHAVLVA